MSRVKEPKIVREETLNNTSIKLIRGDIAKIGGGAIVCPTDSGLNRNSGLSEYLLDKAGNRVLLEIAAWIRENERLQPGDIAITGAGNLPSTYFYFSCIPAFNRDDPEPLVRRFVLRIFEQADEMAIDSIILHCLPKEIFGFTPEQCAYGYLSSAADYLNSHPQSKIKEIKLVTKDKKDMKSFDKEADRRFGAKPKKGFFKFGKKPKKANENGIEL